jgi:hypothetical protein
MTGKPIVEIVHGVPVKAEWRLAKYHDTAGAGVDGGPQSEDCTKDKRTQLHRPSQEGATTSNWMGMIRAGN